LAVHIVEPVFKVLGLYINAPV